MILLLNYFSFLASLFLHHTDGTILFSVFIHLRTVYKPTQTCIKALLKIIHLLLYF